MSRPFDCCYAALCLLVVGCGGDTPSQNTCKTNTDCPNGQYCNSQGNCTADCKTSDDCVAGQKCTSFGKCISGDTDAGPPKDSAPLKPDTKPAPDAKPTPDFKHLDLATPDLPSPDFPWPDLPKPDLPKPDLPKPDLPKPDLPKPDLPAPDLPKPDFPKPDLLKPDLPWPDLPKPDLLTPDQNVPPDLCAQNKCGGCLPINPPPGSLCGACGTLVCKGKNTTVCKDKKPTGVFGAPILVANVNSGNDDIHPSISADGLSLYFSRKTGKWDQVYVAIRNSTTSPFGTPKAISNMIGYRDPSIARNGLAIYLTYTQVSTNAIFVATRSSTKVAFGSPKKIGGPNKSGKHASSPELSPDHKVLYFESNDTGTGPGYGDQKLFTAVRVGSAYDTFTSKKALANISSKCQDGGPSITGGYLTMYFHSSVNKYRNACLSFPPNSNLWMTTRTSSTAQWGVPLMVPGSVNSSAQEFAPDISDDGKVLYFHSDRGGGKGKFDIWKSIRKCN